MMPGVNYVYIVTRRENKSKSITILELNTGGEYCCSYYSRQGDAWQFEKAN